VIVFASHASAADTASVVLNQGQNSFTYDLYLNESEAFAGAEFGLKLSNENALTFTSFTIGNDIAGASALPFDVDKGTHYFGFYTNSNGLSGNVKAGVLSFNYIGDATQTIELTEVRIARIGAGNKGVVTRKPSPALTITVSRAGGSGNTGDGDGNGGDGGNNGDGNGGNNGNPSDGNGGDGSGNPGDNGNGSDGGNTGDGSNNPGGDGNGNDNNGSGSPGNDNSGNPSGSTGNGANLGGGSLTGGSAAQVDTVQTITDGETPLAAGAEAVSKYFGDVDGKWLWAVNEIDSLYESGIVKGVSERIFQPSANITRADFTLMAVRAFNLTAEFSGNFADVPEGSYYYDAVAIARVLGIAKGDGENFNPKEQITRQDLAVILDRILTVVERSIPAGDETELLGFSDQGQVSDYARPSVAAMVKAGIIKGDGTGLNPRGAATRAEAAVMLYRVLNYGGASQVQ
jgi:hypothetical protein